MELLMLEALRKTNDWDYGEDIVLLMWSHLASQLLVFSLHHILNANAVLNAVGKNVSALRLGGVDGRHMFYYNYKIHVHMYYNNKYVSFLLIYFCKLVVLASV